MNALLGAIFAHPEDDDARLVYADSLIESGDTVRGELINVQVRLAALEKSGDVTIPEYRALRRREPELRKQLSHSRDEYVRGFVWRWAAYGGESIALRWRDEAKKEPIEAIFFHASEQAFRLADLHRLATSPGAERLKLISIQSTRGDVVDCDAQTLFASLSGSLEADVWARRAQLPHDRVLPSLVGVHVRDPSTDTLGILAHLDLPHLRRLLIAKSTPDAMPALEQLVKTKAWSQLETIELRGSSARDATVTLAAARAPKHLVVRLAGEHPERAQLEPNVLGAWLRDIERLDLSLAATDASVAVLAEKAPKLADLRLLCMPAPRFDPLAKQLRALNLWTHMRPTGPIAETPFERLTDLQLRAFALVELIDFETLVNVRFYDCYTWSKAARQKFQARWPDAFEINATDQA